MGCALDYALSELESRRIDLNRMGLIRRPLRNQFEFEIVCKRAA